MSKPIPFLQFQLKTSNFRFFWCRYVTGFDMRFHCARCLLGNYSHCIRWNKPEDISCRLRGYKAQQLLNEYKWDYVYLCGVSQVGYEDNLHYVFKPKDHGAVAFENDNIRGVASGVELVKINPVPPEIAAEVPPSFSRCRNWQFGWWAYPSGRCPLNAICKDNGYKPKKPKLASDNNISLFPEPGEIAPDGDFLF